jgi:hypothetical protein
MSIFYPIGDVPLNLVEIVKKRRERWYTLVRDIYYEQLLYLSIKEKNSYFVSAYTEGGIYVGGICLFLENNQFFKHDAPTIQGIAKSVSGFKLLLDTRLNELLIPSIITF